jgi:hypothetical protein
MREVPTYAAVGGPPHDWALLNVFLDGEQVRHIREVNTAEGWALREVVDEQGQVRIKDGDIEVERHKGNYSLQWREAETPLGDPDL